MHFSQPKQGKPMSRQELERRRKRLVMLVPKILDALDTYTSEAEKLKNQLALLPPEKGKQVIDPPPKLVVAKEGRRSDLFAAFGWLLAIAWALAFFLTR